MKTHTVRKMISNILFIVKANKNIFVQLLLLHIPTLQIYKEFESNNLLNYCGHF